VGKHPSRPNCAPTTCPVATVTRTRPVARAAKIPHSTWPKRLPITRVARASRVLVSASSQSRTFLRVIEIFEAADPSEACLGGTPKPAGETHALPGTWRGKCSPRMVPPDSSPPPRSFATNKTRLLHVCDLYDATLCLRVLWVLYHRYVQFFLAFAEGDVCCAITRGDLKYV
jgi:hypothetical protein